MAIEQENIQKDLEDVLKSVADSESIKNYELSFNSNAIRGEGFLSEFFTGEVLNKDNGKIIQVAIKKAPVDGFTAGIKNEEIYNNEIYFYSKAFRELNQFQIETKVKHPFDHVPKYFSGNVESENIFVAMENLKTNGYVLFDKKKFLDSEHLELIFKTYGKLHALSFSFKRKNPEAYEDLVKSFQNIMKKFAESGEVLTIMEKSYSGALDTFDPVTEADILAKLKTVENIPEAFKRLQVYQGCYKCLIHGDCWSNNMLFKYKESGALQDIKLIDFQLSYSSTPVHDLSYFFYSGASKKDMDKLDYYLDLYYESFSNFTRELGENPEEIFPLDVLKKEWKQYGMWGIFLGCQLWLIKLMDREEIATVLEQKGLSDDQYLDLWKEKMSIILKREDFRERVRNICLHAVEYGIL